MDRGVGGGTPLRGVRGNVQKCKSGKVESKRVPDDGDG